MSNLGYLALTIAIAIIAVIVRPTRARCPEHFWANGIRPNGSFSCLRTPVVESDAPADAELGGWIYCMGTIPVLVSEHAVGCRSW